MIAGRGLLLATVGASWFLGRRVDAGVGVVVLVVLLVGTLAILRRADLLFFALATLIAIRDHLMSDLAVIGMLRPVIDPLALAMLAFALVRHTRTPRSRRWWSWGSLWVGPATWAVGSVGALLLVAPQALSSRLGRLALAVLIFGVVVRRVPVRLGRGLVAGHMVVLLAVTWCGMDGLGLGRFEGGSCAHMNTNIVGFFAWTTALFWLGSQRQDAVLRLLVAGACGSLIFFTNSRSATGALALGGVVLIAVLLFRWMQRRPEAKRRSVDQLLVAGVAAFLLVGVALVGWEFFFRVRDPAMGVFHGRVATWRLTLEYWGELSPGAKLLGDPGNPIGWDSARPGVVVDNAYLAFLNRAGIVGLLVSLVGTAILLGKAAQGARRGVIPWASAMLVPGLAIGIVSTVPSLESLWMWFVVAESMIHSQLRSTAPDREGRERPWSWEGAGEAGLDVPARSPAHESGLGV